MPYIYVTHFCPSMKLALMSDQQTSRKIEKWTSWDAKASMIRSASCNYASQSQLTRPVQIDRVRKRNWIDRYNIRN